MIRSIAFSVPFWHTELRVTWTWINEPRLRSHSNVLDWKQILTTWIYVLMIMREGSILFIYLFYNKFHLNVALRVWKSSFKMRCDASVPIIGRGEFQDRGRESRCCIILPVAHMESNIINPWMYTTWGWKWRWLVIECEVVWWPRLCVCVCVCVCVLCRCVI